MDNNNMDESYEDDEGNDMEFDNNNKRGGDHGNDMEEDEDAVLREGKRLYAKLVEYMKPSQAAKVAADLSGAPRKALYGGD